MLLVKQFFSSNVNTSVSSFIYKYSYSIIYCLLVVFYVNASNLKLTLYNSPITINLSNDCLIYFIDNDIEKLKSKIIL